MPRSLSRSSGPGLITYGAVITMRGPGVSPRSIAPLSEMS